MWWRRRAAMKDRRPGGMKGFALQKFILITNPLALLKRRWSRTGYGVSFGSR
jgi:hypothetical protein